MRTISLLGSTGSIGRQSLDVIAACQMSVAAVTANRSVALLEEQVRQFRPRLAVCYDPDAAADLKVRVADTDTRVAGGMEGLLEAATLPEADTVLTAVVGMIGLEPTLAAIEEKKRIALANKETLVCAGELVMAEAERCGAEIVPVDSEHSAIAQALASGVHEKGLTSPVVSGRSEVADLVLTASGGPFRGRTREQLRGVRAAQALAHPTWDMGPVVTINSSTLINKGLELIEAHLLFDVAPEHIVATVHPQSIVHSMVTWRDGATTLQASPPDMRLPIALGLTWPERLDDVEAPLEWANPSQWTFEPVDNETFPAINLARFAVGASATHPAVLNAANEVMVDAFIEGVVPWLAIVDTVSAVVHEHEGVKDPSLEDIVAAQRWADRRAREYVAAGQWKDM